MIDFDLFYDWCVDRFGEENLKIRNTAHGVEICTHSFFARQKLGIDDRKYHLWMSPQGGKKHLKGGAYRCWYTDAMGSLVDLVSTVDHIDYEEAEELLLGCSSLRALEKKVHDFFRSLEGLDPEVNVELTEKSTNIQLPDFSFLIDKLPPAHNWRVKARNYLKSRKIPTEGLYVCTAGEHRDRIVIPYYDRNGNLIWWNARTMSQNKKVIRYAKPSGNQESVLYMTSWPETASKVFVMEGEFDAISLALAGFVACACGGKYLSQAQIELLRGYQIVLAFDADPSGYEALINTGTSLLEYGFTNLSYLRPPKIYKDWNKLLQQKGVEILNQYVQSFQKPFSWNSVEMLRARNLGS